MQIHVFAPGRIQENIPGELFMYLVPGGNTQSHAHQLHISICWELNCIIISPPMISFFLRNSEKGALENISIKLSEIDFPIRDEFATILHTLPLMHETK